MVFEHLVQINALDQPEIPWLTREQVWRGLALRAYDPAHFILGLDACSIRHHERLDTHEVLERTLHFGSFEVHDKVVLHPLHQTEVNVEGNTQWPRSRNVARIEEPEPNSLFIRFIYEWDEQSPSEVGLPDNVRHAREQAYKAADLDTVQRIREIANNPLL